MNAHYRGLMGGDERVKKRYDSAPALIAAVDVIPGLMRCGY